MHRIEVMTPSGPGIIWGIAPGKVIVEMDYMYLVEFDPEDVEGIEGGFGGVAEERRRILRVG